MTSRARVPCSIYIYIYIPGHFLADRIDPLSFFLVPTPSSLLTASSLPSF